MPWREQLRNEHDQRTQQDLWRKRITVESPQGRSLTVDGKSYLNFCSNDYLGLAGHPKVIAAASQSLESRGFGSGASHLVCGHLDEHHQLEQEIAGFVGAEKAIVFSTGYMANLAVPQTFLGRSDLVVQDKLNHASLIDAGRHCPAKMKRYSHLDVDEAEGLLAGSDAKRKMVTTDGVFSMDGDTAPLNRLVEICKAHDSVLLVDDAHGFGVLGETGIGLLEACGIQPTGNVLMIGTHGKAVGTFGAFVAGDAIYIDSLIQFARTYIYTTALPPSVIAATRAAIEIIRTEPVVRKTLHHNIKYFRESCADANIQLTDSQTPIQPILLPSSETAIKASQQLKENGLLVIAIRPPTVPVGSSRLRITLSAHHSETDIDLLVKSLQGIMSKEFMS